ncbi:zinc transporter ZIP3-like [Diabrotica undecimpunctata]|uniref:zinc transporter ZIP3-like n=1 Tax=Diabrotica undecimpunctata TaxID=50387 RepID=UPI003B6366B8
MNLLTTKIFVAVLFFFVRFFFSILPVKLYNFLKKWEDEDDSSGQFVNQKRHRQVTLAIAFCQSFGGGVLFATCFLHMMLEVYKSMEELKTVGDLNTEYPLSQLAICVGFFFVYFLEEISHWAITRIPDKGCEASKKINNFTRSAVKPINESVRNSPVKAFVIEEQYEKELNKEDNESKPVDEDENSIRKLKQGLSIDEDHENIVYDSLSLNSEVTRQNEKNAQLSKEYDKENYDETAEEKMEEEIKSKQQIMRGVLTVVALSFHAVFEGLAIGLQKATGDIWYLFIAVCIHSATILFCISLEMVIAKVNFKAICMHSIGLAISNPLGVVLGIIVTYTSDTETKAKSTAIVALEGLSAGTILYITFFEVLNREKERRVYRITRAICILGGFGLMAVLQWYR